MIAEDEFFDFLTSNYQGGRTYQAISIRAARDTVSRCKRVERVLSLTLFDFFKSEGDLSALTEKIKSNRHALGATQANPYGYNNVKHAARLYQEFLKYCGKI